MRERPIIAFSAGAGYVSGAARGRPPGTSGTITTTVAAVTTAQVVAVRFSPTLTILTRSDAALPNRYRIAVSIHETAGAVPRGGVASRIGPAINPLNWAALDRKGRAIATSLRPGARATRIGPSDKAAY